MRRLGAHGRTDQRAACAYGEYPTVVRRQVVGRDETRISLRKPAELSHTTLHTAHRGCSTSAAQPPAERCRAERSRAASPGRATGRQSRFGTSVMNCYNLLCGMHRHISCPRAEHTGPPHSHRAVEIAHRSGEGRTPHRLSQAQWTHHTPRGRAVRALHVLVRLWGAQGRGRWRRALASCLAHGGGEAISTDS